MPITKTTSATQAIQRGEVTAERTKHLETLSDAVLKLGEAEMVRDVLGLRDGVSEGAALDAVNTAFKGTVGRLSLAELDVFSRIYGEALQNASAALLKASGENSSPSVVRLSIAERALTKAILSAVHGPKTHFHVLILGPQPTSPGFEVAAHPEFILKNVRYTDYVTTPEGGYLDVAYTDKHLGSERTEHNLAKGEVTPEAISAAVRQVLGANFQDVELRVRLMDDSDE